MSKIITITFNPCIDKSATVSVLKADKKMYCSEPKFEPGGGGINVARVISRLGGEAVAVFPAGGYTGEYFSHLLQKENVPTIVVPIEHSMRENVIILDESTNDQYRFGFPGAQLHEHEWKKCLEVIEAIHSAKYIVASGSIPDGVPGDIFAMLAVIAKRKNIRLIIDTSSEALEKAVDEGVYMLKPNIGELRMLVGRPELPIEEIPEAGRQIISKGKCEVLVISMGRDGAMLLTKDTEFIVKSPEVPKHSTVGAGDSMVAGIVLQLSKGKSIQEAFLYGVASGTAATMNPGTELCHAHDCDRLYDGLIFEYQQYIVIPA
jgi:6-phosphofructokinase 2